MAWSLTNERAATLSDCLRGGLGILRVRCSRCPRRGAYDVRRALAVYGDIDLIEFGRAKNMGADCPNRDAMIDAQRCSIVFPDLTLLYAPKCYQCDNDPRSRPHTIADAVRRYNAVRDAKKMGR